MSKQEDPSGIDDDVTINLGNEDLDELDQSSSVFDDTEEDEAQARESDSSSKTQVMPGRYAQIDPASAFDEDDADKTEIVAPEAAPKQEASGKETSTPGGEPTQPDRQTPQSRPAAAGRDQQQSEQTGKSNLGFVLLASYASVMTIATVLLLFFSDTGKSENLESLPDIEPEPITELSHVPVNAILPAGHTLKLGEKRRFGNIEVEPLHLTKAPLVFDHYLDSKLSRDPSKPVYQLWVRFTNVSKDQEIVPLDANLLYRWVNKADSQREFSNNYLFPAGLKNDSGVFPTYRHSRTSEWDIRDQELGTMLQPGESVEIFIPSAEEISESLSGEIHWRFQFRKGHSPKGYGVTTVVEVETDTTQLASET